MLIPDWLWIILIGSLVAVSCSLVGTFLVLRRMAMLGDAISHSVLPGIAIAFLLTNSRNSWIMLIGAAAVGVLTAFSVQVLSSKARVRNGAAIGVTFTFLFALGVILISRYASKVDLDTDCVLYGVLELTPLNTLHINGADYGPLAFWQMLVVFALTLGFVVLFYKELKLTSFDAPLATALGINALVMHLRFDGDGFGCDRGFVRTGRRDFGGGDDRGAARDGVFMDARPEKNAVDFRAHRRFFRDGGLFPGLVLGRFGRGHDDDGGGSTLRRRVFLFAHERAADKESRAAQTGRRNRARRRAASFVARARTARTGFNRFGHRRSRATRIANGEKMLGHLSSGGLVQESNARFSLTPQGETRARELVHRHRVYESYLGELGYPPDHQHDAADRAEHFLSPALIETIDEAAGNPTVDPHGREIPH